MGRKSNGIVDAAILYIVILFFVYIFYMLYTVIKYTVLTAIGKRKRRKNNGR